MRNNFMAIISHLSMMLLDPSLSSAEKIEKIKFGFRSSSEIRYDEDSQKYLDNTLDDFWSPVLRARYLAQTQGLAVNMGGRLDWTLLMVASQVGDVEVMKCLVEELGASVNLGNWFGMSPLFVAAGKGHLKAMDYLISKGANINQKTFFSSDDTAHGPTCSGSTPLHQTIRYGQKEACKKLLKSNASVIPDMNGQTPFDTLSLFTKILQEGEQEDLVRLFGRDQNSYPSLENLESIKKHILHNYKYHFFTKSITDEKHLNPLEKTGAKLFTKQLVLHHSLFQKMDKKYQKISKQEELNVLEFLNGKLDGQVGLRTLSLFNQNKEQSEQTDQLENQTLLSQQ